MRFNIIATHGVYVIFENLHSLSTYSLILAEEGAENYDIRRFNPVYYKCC